MAGGAVPDGAVAADAGDRGGRTPASLPSGSDRFVVDYLRAEVLAGLPEPDARLPAQDVHPRRARAAAVRRRGGPPRLRGCAVRTQPSAAAGGARSTTWATGTATTTCSPMPCGQTCRGRSRGWRPSCTCGPRTGSIRTAIRTLRSGTPRRPATSSAPARSCGPVSRDASPPGAPTDSAAWLADLDDLQVRSDRWLTLAAAWLGLQTGDPDRMTRWILAAEAHAGPGWATAHRGRRVHRQPGVHPHHHRRLRARRAPSSCAEPHSGGFRRNRDSGPRPSRTRESR